MHPSKEGEAMGELVPDTVMATQASTESRAILREKGGAFHGPQDLTQSSLTCPFRAFPRGISTHE